MSWVQFEKHSPELFQAYRQDPYGFRHPSSGAESLAFLAGSRTLAFINRLKETYNEHSFVIVFTHSDWILSCRAILEDILPNEFNERFLKSIHYPGHLEGIWYQTDSKNSTRPHRKKHIIFPSKITSLEGFAEPEWEEIEPRVQRTG